MDSEEIVHSKGPGGWLKGEPSLQGINHPLLQGNAGETCQETKFIVLVI